MKRPSILRTALKSSRELKNEGMTAQTLGYEGDSAFYRGDLKTAKGLYERATQAAERTTEPDKKLIAKLNLAKLAVQEGRSREAIATLKPLAQKAETQGLKYVAVQCSLLMAEAMVQVKDYAHAKPELEQILLRSDKLDCSRSREGALLARHDCARVRKRRGRQKSCTASRAPARTDVEAKGRRESSAALGPECYVYGSDSGGVEVALG